MPAGRAARSTDICAMTRSVPFESGVSPSTRQFHAPKRMFTIFTVGVFCDDQGGDRREPGRGEDAHAMCFISPPLGMRSIA